MTAKIIRFPTKYPDDIDGVMLFRSKDGWALRRTHGGRIVEMRGLSLTELRDLHSSIELAIEITE